MTPEVRKHGSDLELALHSFPAKNYGLRLGRATSRLTRNANFHNRSWRSLFDEAIRPPNPTLYISSLSIKFPSKSAMLTKLSLQDDRGLSFNAQFKTTLTLEVM